MARIEVLIPENPNEKATQIRVFGVKGGGCEALTRSLESALGSTTSQEKTDEFYEEPLAQDEWQYQ